MSPVEHENYVCNQDVEAPAGEWLHGRLAARLATFGRRGFEILNEQTIFEKPAIASQSRVFRFSTKTMSERKDMNTNKTRVPTEFGPETRFELRPGPPAPFRATRETEFERLKDRLLAEQLDGATPEVTVPLRRAANEAAALAWVTFYPLLVFPVLFEEKTAVALRQAQRQARIYTDSRDLLAV